MDAAADLERRALITFKARANAENRVRTTGRSWNLALVTSSSLVLVGTIFAVQDETVFSSHTAPILAAASAVVLIQSLVVSQAHYEARAAALAHSYMTCKDIATELEILRDGGSVDADRLSVLAEQYREAQQLSENHETRDYLRALDENPKLRKAGDGEDTVEDEGGKRLRGSLYAVGSRLPWLFPAVIALAGFLGWQAR